MNQRKFAIALTQGFLVLSFALDTLTLLAILAVSSSEAWLTMPFWPALGLTVGVGDEWTQRGLWAALGYLVLVPLGKVGVMNRAQGPGWSRTLQTLSRGLLVACGVLIVASIISKTYGAGASKLGFLVEGLRSSVMALTALVLMARIHADAGATRNESSVSAAELPGEVPDVVAPEATGEGGVASGFFRRWWHWRAQSRGADWVFGAFVVLGVSVLGWRLITQRAQESAYRAVGDCLAHADVTCANAATQRLSNMGAVGPRLKVVLLDTQLLAEGWTPATAESLRTLQVESGTSGLSGAEALLALGDAAAAHGEGALARTQWAAARGKGADAWIEARVTRLVDQEAASAAAEREAQAARVLEDEVRRSVDAARVLAEAGSRKDATRGALKDALSTVQRDFDAALDDAQQGRVESLQIRLRVLLDSTNGLPALATVRIQAAVMALSSAGAAAQRVAYSRVERKRIRQQWYQEQLDAQEAADRAKLEQGIALAQEQFNLAMEVLNGLPVRMVEPPPVQVIPLGGR